MLCCSTYSSFSLISLLVDGLSQNHSPVIPFYLMLSAKYNTDLWSIVVQLVVL